MKTIMCRSVQDSGLRRAHERKGSPSEPAGFIVTPSAAPKSDKYEIHKSLLAGTASAASSSAVPVPGSSSGSASGGASSSSSGGASAVAAVCADASVEPPLKKAKV